MPTPQLPERTVLSQGLLATERLGEAATSENIEHKARSISMLHSRSALPDYIYTCRYIDIYGMFGL